MSVSTQAVTVTKSGTSFTIDVTSANLLANSTVKDFKIINVLADTILDNDDFTKDSATQITYSGSDIGTDVELEVRRDTPVTRFQELLYNSKLSSAVLNTEIDRILRRQAEFFTFGAGPSSAGVSANPLNQTYSSLWSNDTTRGRVAKVIYDKIESVVSSITNNTTNITTNANNIALKANINTPALTGSPTATTPAAGNNSTRIATTAYVQTELTDYSTTTAMNTAIQALYPVGSVYINASNATNPGTLLGFGTWEAFGAGRVPVGIDASQTEFDTAEETGGSKTHTLTTGEMPSHSHNVLTGDSGPGGGTLVYRATSGLSNQATSNTGSGEAHNNLQPYIVVHMWKRTA